MKTKGNPFYLYLFILLGFISQSVLPIFAQTPEFSYAKTVGGILSDGSTDTALDSEGGRLVSGWFSDNVQVGSTLLESNGAEDILIAKYSPEGDVLWAQSAGGNSKDVAHAITIDNMDNVIATGTFFDTTYFSNSGRFISAGFSDVFLTKLNGEGEFLWSQHIGGPQGDYSNSVAADSSNNIIYAGFFSQETEIADTMIYGSDNRNILIAKFAENGALKWAKHFPATDEIHVYEVKTDKNDNIYLAGAYQRQISFIDTTLQNNALMDAFVVKLDSFGELKWVNAFGANEHDMCFAMTLDSNNGIIITGGFSGSVSFGETILYTPYRLNIFTAKMDESGSFEWAKQGFHLIGQSLALDISTDRNNNVYLTGFFTDSLQFENYIFDSMGETDAFIAKYNHAGQLAWAKQIGGKGPDMGTGIRKNSRDKILLNGYFSDAVNFDSHVLTSNGNRDIFIASLIEEPSTFITPSSSIHKNFELRSNYPNPFNPKTRIEFVTQEPMHVTLEIFDINGRFIEQVIDGFLVPGFHQAEWNSSGLSSGVYFYRLSSGSDSETRKMMLLK